MLMFVALRLSTTAKFSGNGHIIYINFRGAGSHNIMSWYIQFNKLYWVALRVVDTCLSYCFFTKIEEARSLMATRKLAGPKLEQYQACVHNECDIPITDFVGLGMCYITTSPTTTSCFFPSRYDLDQQRSQIRRQQQDFDQLVSGPTLVTDI